MPVLYAAVNTACEIEGYVNIECRGTGQTLNGKEVAEITETLLFQNGNLVLHFFAQKISASCSSKGGKELNLFEKRDKRRVESKQGEGGE